MARRLPLELWLKIFALRPELSPWKLFLGRIKLPEADIKHSKVWDAIFDKYDYLMAMSNQRQPCMLLGSGLHYIYNSNPEETLQKQPEGTIQQQPEEIHLVLVCGEFWSPSDKMTSLFLKSLKKTILPISLDKRPNEVNIAYGTRHTIRLTIKGLWTAYYHTSIIVNNPEKLFTLKDDGLYSAYLYWKNDRKKLRTIKPKDIVGVGRYASRCKKTCYVSSVCGIIIQQPAEYPTELPIGLMASSDLFAGKGFPRQIVFEEPLGTMNLIAKYRDENNNSKPRWCIGWEYKDDVAYNERLWR